MLTESPGTRLIQRSCLEWFLSRLAIVDENWNGYNLDMDQQAAPPVRRTRQRQAVQEALEQEETFRSAQDLHACIRNSGSAISLATVYNQLRQMAARHEVDVLRSDAGEALYRRCGAAEHHHHLRCRRCGNVEELEAPAVELWATTVATSSGWSEVSHVLEVTGLCPGCADVRS